MYSKTFAEHLANIKQVLANLKAHVIKLKPSKCKLFRQRVRYLGRIILASGYSMDPADTAAVNALKEKTPTTVDELRKILGFLGYYRQYIKDFSRHAKPLYDLLSSPVDAQDQKYKRQKSGSGKNTSQLPNKHPNNWLQNHQHQLEFLISQLTSPPVMAFPDFEKPFILHTDASNEGLGTVLYQQQASGLRVLGYASRTLSPAEKNYHLHAGKLEFLALKWAIKEKFRDYLYYASSFTVYTDNNAFTYILTTTKLNATGHRWVAELADYNFSIKYCPGRLNTDADTLSRLPLDPEEFIVSCTVEMDGAGVMAAMQPVKEDRDNSRLWVNTITSKYSEANAEPTMTQLGFQKMTPTEILRHQQEDPVIAKVMKYKLKGVPPKSNDRKCVNRDVHALLRELRRLHIHGDGTLWRKTKTRRQLVLPSEFKPLVYQELHVNIGHLESDRVLDLARSRFYWPRMQQDIEQFIKQKCRCIHQKQPNITPCAPLMPITATAPFEIIAIDFLHLKKSSRGNEYILLVVDHFTRFCQAYPTRNKFSLTVAKKIYDDFIPRFGFPSRIHHD